MSRPRSDSQAPDTVTAAQLCATHIGTLIRFRVTDDEHETVSIITAELRQLSINQGHVTVIVGLGAEQEHVLDPVDTVILRPDEDYAEVASMLGNDPEYAQFGLR